MSTVAAISLVIVAAAMAGVVIWALATIRELVTAANREADEHDAHLSLLGERVVTLQRTVDALTGRVEDHIAGLDAPPPVKKAAPRKRTAPKKGTTR